MYNITIEELSKTCDITVSSLYNLFKKNRAFINQNSKRYGHKIKYNQAVLDFCLEYYQKQYAAEGGETRPAESENKPADASLSADGGETAKEDITALKAQIAALEEKLAAKENECAELIKQNGACLLLLSQEKAEKQLFLPAPKKSFTEKLKGIFGK